MPHSALLSRCSHNINPLGAFGIKPCLQESFPDTRNSKVVDMIELLAGYQCDVDFDQKLMPIVPSI